MTKPSIALILLSISIFSCEVKEEIAKTSLRDAFASDFYIGAALDCTQILKVNPVETELIKNEFSSITAENIMKWMYIHPEQGEFDFQLSDDFVNLGFENDAFIIGHTLVWHSQLADWVHDISDSTEMANMLKDHITTIVSRYKGKVQGYDVVNEAVNDDGTIRESIFHNVIGPEYLSYTFKWAAEVDPEAELYYNDYNLWIPEKRDAVVEMVKGLQENGIRIDGIGMQGHYGLDGPKLEDIEASIVAFAELGVKVMVTELDINVLPNPWDLQGADVNQDFEGDDSMNMYKEALPDSVNSLQAKRYADLFRLYLKHSESISRITFWGVHDKQSWKNNWPIKGRTDYPLVFDRDFEPKEAYFELLKLAEK